MLEAGVEHGQEFIERCSWLAPPSADAGRGAARHGDIPATGRSGRTGFGVPAVHIDDQPRFAWRGLMMDVSRHWMPIEVVKRNLDGMAAVKLNVFHWHLSDEPGIPRRKQGVSQAARNWAPTGTTTRRSK